MSHLALRMNYLHANVMPDRSMDELPIIVAGSANGRIKTGRILNCPEKTPLANLWLSQAQLMGTGMEQFADSTGPLKGLLA